MLTGDGLAAKAGLCRCRVAGCDLLCDRHGDTVRVMVLMHHRIAKDKAGVKIQIEIPIYAHRHQRGIPVPAEIALRLADHVAAYARVMLGEGHEIGLACLPLLSGARR